MCAFERSIGPLLSMSLSSSILHVWMSRCGLHFRSNVVTLTYHSASQVVGKRAMIRDNAYLLPDSVLPPETMVLCS